jgi:hypothetical protein
MTSVRKTYCTGLISSLFDIDNKMLINYKLYKKHDERSALMKQINYLRKGDIVIMDRGYYGKNFYFFSMKKKSKLFFV